MGIEYVKYVVSKMDCPNRNNYNRSRIDNLDTKIFNIDNLNKLLDSDNFKIKFNKFVELQIIIYNKKIIVPQIIFLNGIIIYRPNEFIDVHNYIFMCCNSDTDIVIFKEIYGKRCRKILGHIIIADNFDEFITYLEESVLLSV